MTNVRQVDLAVDDCEFEALRCVIDSRWLTEGPETARLAGKLKEHTRSRYVTFAPNGTLGLFLALSALDLPPGGEILMPAFTFYGSASAAVFAGLRPVFVDCSPETYNIDIVDLQRRITENSVAIMPVHIYGQACEIDKVMQVAQRHDLRVVEDAAQAFGVTFGGRHTGTFGDIGVVSFYSDKVITMGEGAALFTQDEALYERLRLMRNQGRVNSGTFVHPALGMNFRITDLQAAIGCVQMNKFPGILGRRLELFDLYSERLRSVAGVDIMRVHEKSSFVPFRFPFTTKRRELMEEHLRENGIETRGFFHPMHLQPQLRRFSNGALPVSERIAREGVCLPVHARISDSDADRICDVICSFHQISATDEAEGTALAAQ